MHKHLNLKNQMGKRQIARANIQNKVVPFAHVWNEIQKLWTATTTIQYHQTQLRELTLVSRMGPFEAEKGVCAVSN